MNSGSLNGMGFAHRLKCAAISSRLRRPRDDAKGQAGRSIMACSPKDDAHRWLRSGDRQPTRPLGRVDYGYNAVQEIVGGTLRVKDLDKNPCSSCGVGFSHDMFDVFLYSLFCDLEGISNLFISPPFRQMFNDRLFTIC